MSGSGLWNYVHEGDVDEFLHTDGVVELPVRMSHGETGKSKKEKTEFHRKEPKPEKKKE